MIDHSRGWNENAQKRRFSKQPAIHALGMVLQQTILTHRTTILVNGTIAPTNENYGLSADGRITLRTALSNAHHFVGIILQHFYNLELFLLLFDTKQHIDDAYSVYNQRILASVSYPLLRSLWEKFREQKTRFRKMTRRIIDGKFWTRTVVHRITEVEDKSIEGKRVVLNPTDVSLFPEDKFCHMYSDRCHVVDSTSRQVELHLCDRGMSSNRRRVEAYPCRTQ